MREILFRGKRTGNGDWIYWDMLGHITTHTGNISKYTQKTKYGESYYYYAYQLWNRIDHSTIGQYTGLKDKNGKRIFEGDIIEWFAQGESEHPDFGYIKYDEQSFAWCVCWHKYDPDFMEGMQQEYISVVGNIHDNPELS